MTEERPTRIRNYEKQERCDHCKKWVNKYQLVTLPEELYPILNGDNEFAICLKCDETHTINYWKTWIEKKRTGRDKENEKSN